MDRDDLGMDRDPTLRPPPLPQFPPPPTNNLELVLTAVERLAVVAAITYVWAAGKLDPTIAVVALTAVVGVSLGERRFRSGKGGASILLMLAGVATSFIPHSVT